MNCNTIKIQTEFSSTTSSITTTSLTTSTLTTNTIYSTCPTYSDNEKLVKISFNELKNLRDIYKKKNYCYSDGCNQHFCYDNNNYCCNCWFEHHIGYQTINNYLKWLNLDLNEMKRLTQTIKTTNPATLYYFSTGKNDNCNGIVDDSDDDDDDDDKNKEMEINCSFKNMFNRLKYNNDIRATDDDVNVDIVEIYSLNGNWKTDGFFVIVDNYQIIFNILVGFNPNKLIIALNLLEKIIQPKLKFPLKILNGFSNRFLIPVTKYMKQMEYNMNHNMNVNTLWYFLPKFEVKKFDIIVPKNIRLDKLSENHAKIINDNWSWKHKGSEDLIRRLIKYNENIGAYNITSGELVGWCLRQQVGALGVLYVLKSYRKQGLASLIVKKISKIISENNDSDDICATVLDINIPSRRLFDSLGFKIVNQANWIVIEHFTE